MKCSVRGESRLFSFRAQHADRSEWLQRREETTCEEGYGDDAHGPAAVKGTE